MTERRCPTERGTVAVLDTGPGDAEPTVVAVHGTCSASGSYRRFLSTLQPACGVSQPIRAATAGPTRLRSMPPGEA